MKFGILNLLILVMAFGCATSNAWVKRKNENGGVIGYAKEGTFTSKDKIRVDFEKAAKKICRKSKWQITEETLSFSPPAISVLSPKEQTKAKVENVGWSYLGYRRSQNSRFAPNAKTSYNPLNSWNEAKIRCIRRKTK